jgi:predicted porin
MRQICVLGLTIVMLFSCGIAVIASTIGVNVSEGASVSLEKPHFGQDSLKFTGNFGVNDNLLVWSGYTTETAGDSDDATWCLGIRYELAKNFAAIFEYRIQDNRDELDFGVRGKVMLSEPLALVGEAKYLNYSPKNYHDYIGYSFLAQAEYTFNAFATANVGLQVKGFDSKDAETLTSLLAGVEFYPTEQFTCWLDYTAPQDSDDDAFIGVGIEYKF